MASGKRPVLSLSIPFYNEEENARKCVLDHVRALEKAGIDFEIMAVDNASIDSTGRILDSLASGNVRVLHIGKNIGYANGIMQGWKHAKGSVFGFTCGDNEISADSVALVFSKMQKEGLDFCMGKRIWKDYGLFRKIESVVYNRFVCRLLLGYIEQDINGYPKLMTRALYEKLGIESLGPMFDTEILMKAKAVNAMTGVVPVKYMKRKKGSSSVPFYIAVVFVVGIVKLKLRQIFGRL